MTVTQYFGVKCKNCKRPIKLEEYTPSGPMELTAYVVPLEKIKCSLCGHEDSYGSQDAIYFQG